MNPPPPAASLVYVWRFCFMSRYGPPARTRAVLSAVAYLLESGEPVTTNAVSGASRMPPRRVAQLLRGAATAGWLAVGHGPVLAVQPHIPRGSADAFRIAAHWISRPLAIA